MRLTVWARRLITRPIDTFWLAYWRARGYPAQSRRDIAVCLGTLLAQPDPLRVFEWGMGRSTVYYARVLAAAGRLFEWHGVDHSRPWYDRMRRAIAAHGLADRVFPHLFEFRNPWEIAGAHCFATFPDAIPAEQYIMAPERLGGTFSVLLIDGRFRRRYVEFARRVVRAHGAVLLFDAQRAYHHPAFNLYPNGMMIDGGHLPRQCRRSQLWIGRVASP